MRARLDSDLVAELEDFARANPLLRESPGELIGIPGEFALAKIERLEELQSAREAFQVRYDKALDDKERAAAILQFAEVMGSSGQQYRSDARQVGEPFDADAVLERFRRRRGHCERLLAFAADRLSAMAITILPHMERPAWHAALTKNASPVLARLRSHKGDPRVRAAAYRCLSRLAKAATRDAESFWIDAALRDIRRASLDNSEDCWVQCEALEALFHLDADSVDGIVERRLEKPSTMGTSRIDDNRLFVRRRLAFLLSTHLAENPHLERHYLRLAKDTDGAVRQAVAESLPFAPRPIAGKIAPELVTDADAQVRATLLARVGLLAPTLGGAATLDIIRALLSDHDDEFVTRCAIAASSEFVDWAAAWHEGEASDWAQTLRKALADLRQTSTQPRVRRWAGEASERIWLSCDAEGRAIAEIIVDAVDGMSEGQTRRAPALAPYLAADEARVGRVMSVLTQQDFGLVLSGGKIPRLTRGEVFERRIWRTLYEFKLGATDKRQAFLHTIGRAFRGTIIAPSAHLAELAPTAVPGEPLHIANEGGWRNYLPLLDLVLAAVDRGEEARIYTSEGVTSIVVPRSVRDRIAIWWQITRRFADLADLRNADPAAYRKQLAALDISLEHRPHDEAVSAPDSGITRIFSAGVAAC